jgi:hypothetical protein
LFRYDLPPLNEEIGSSGLDEVKRLSSVYKIDNLNYIKPGIGETTRVLLRRVPWKILIDRRYEGSRELQHIVRLAEDKDVEVEYTELNNYKCCGLIKQLSDI